MAAGEDAGGSEKMKKNMSVEINRELNQTIRIENGCAVITDDADNYVCLDKSDAQVVTNFLLRWLERTNT
jgi:hypothetical protein